VGKNQAIFIVGWIYPVPTGGTSAGRIYYNITFTITRPDGTTEIRVHDTNTEATTGFNYACSTAGTWKVKIDFPGDLVLNDRTPATATYQWTVTETPIPVPAQNPLPTGPWSYPISPLNQEWYQISGDWAKVYSDGGQSNANYYSDGPDTAHILWKQLYSAVGGLLGGDQGYEYAPRSNYITSQTNPVASHGRIYFTRTGYGAGGNTSLVTEFDDAPLLYCVDQKTGETIWTVRLPTINYTTGQNVAAARTGGGTLQMVTLAISKGVSPIVAGFAGGDQYGERYLWVSGGGLWKVDPLTGEILWYQLQPALSPVYYDGAWYISGYPSGNYSCVSAIGDKYDSWDVAGIVWTKSLTQSSISASYITEGYIVAVRTTGTLSEQQRRLETWNAKTGALIANGTFSYGASSEGSSTCAGLGNYYIHNADGCTRAWSFKTGSLAWTSQPMNMPWGLFGNYHASVGYGVVIQASYDGYKYAYNVTNGNLVWKQFAGDNNPYNFEYAQNAPPTWGTAVLADNKVYWASGEHTAASPAQRGDRLYCNDATTGALLWSLNGFKGTRGFVGGISSGMLWYWNQYDGCIYMFGKGETQTTVTAPQTAVSLGNGIVIQGRVTDMSPGAAGTPAVSDASMSDWMANVYMQLPLPANTMVTGVTVHLVATTASGNVIDIGHTQTDSNGYYGMMWTPENSDLYTVIASFEGSGAYYSSYAETSVGVAPAVSQAPSADQVASQVVSQLPPTPDVPSADQIAQQVVSGLPPTVSANEIANQVANKVVSELPAVSSTDYAIIAAVVIAIVIGLANLVMLKKRK